MQKFPESQNCCPSGGRLVQAAAQSRVTYSRLSRTVSHRVSTSSADRDSATSLDSLFHSLTTLKGEKKKRHFFLYLNGIPCISICACCLLHLPWIPLRRDGLNLFTPAHQVFMYMEMCRVSPPPSLLFSRLNTPSSPSLPSRERRSNPLIIFEVVCWTCQECPCCTGSVTEDIVSGELVVLGKQCALQVASSP